MFRSSQSRLKQLLLGTAIIAVMGTIMTSIPCDAVDDSKTGMPIETKEQKDARMKWWREARFGMFIHWGLYAVPAGEWAGKKYDVIGEWLMHEAKIPLADYQKLTQQFNPTKYDAEQWVLAAKNAGMKYIVITSKHHDGFAMFHSKASAFNIYDATPFKHDPLKELAAACQKHGIRLGFYYSQAQDWNNPGGQSIGGRWDAGQEGSTEEYVKNVAIPQVKEILSNYGKISILWWDTPVGIDAKQLRELASLAKLQPGLITNNRLGGKIPGDVETPEQYIPATGIADLDWETCMTMNDTWGYKWFDHNWKPTKMLIRNLVDIASKGGNYLLNVGPTAEGLFPSEITQRLKEVGDWMKINSESIYATSASPFSTGLTWGRCTRKGSKLYLHVFDWPTDGLLRVPAHNQVKRAYLLSDSTKKLVTSDDKDGITITVPQSAPDAIDSVVVLEIRGEPKVDSSVATVTANEPLVLVANECKPSGKGIWIQTLGGRTNISQWKDPAEYVEWNKNFAKVGAYSVTIEYSLAPNCAGSAVRLECSGDRLDISPSPTKDWQTFQTMKCGRIMITETGVQSIILRPIGMPGDTVMNIRTVTLKPIS